MRARKSLRLSPASGRVNFCALRLPAAVVRTAGTCVLVDSKSALYLKGTHLDYSPAMVAGGFKFSNPNAKASCSCGESFSV